MMKSTILLARSPPGRGGAGDDHEADDDRSGLADLPTIRPLYSLQLAPASSQEVSGGCPRAVGSRGRARRRGRRPRPASTWPLRPRFLEALLGVVDAVLELLELLLVGELGRSTASSSTSARRRRCASTSSGRPISSCASARSTSPLASSAARVVVLGVGRAARRAAPSAARCAAGGTCLAVSALLRSSAVAGHGSGLASESPDAPCATCTNGSTCAAGSARDRCACSCSSGSSVRLQSSHASVTAIRTSPRAIGVPRSVWARVRDRVADRQRTASRREPRSVAWDRGRRTVVTAPAGRRLRSPEGESRCSAGRRLRWPAGNDDLPRARVLGDGACGHRSAAQ